MFLIMPGRHLALTRFQFEYLKSVIAHGPGQRVGVDGLTLGTSGAITGLIFPITSANHHDTRRNPVPFTLRVLALHDFAQELGVPAWIYGIEDVGQIDDFPSFVLRRLSHLSEGRFSLNPENAVVAVSTDTYRGWAKLGFHILPVERNTGGPGYLSPLPGELIEAVGRAPRWQDDPLVGFHLHPACRRVWENYGVGETVARLWKDPILGDDGDLTATRDYGSYVRSMDENAVAKYQETAPHIRPGRIGDIGCAAGSWIKQAAGDPRHRECEFYGVEVVRKLFDICQQRKENGEFATPWVFFAIKNAVGGGVFEKGTMNTIHTSALTHEIYSYGSLADLKGFIANRFVELRPGGVWVNRDVVGPENAGRLVLMELSTVDGNDEVSPIPPLGQKEFENYLTSRSTRVRFIHFASDFRPGKGEGFPFEWVEGPGPCRVRLTLARACEFLYKKDYPDNWQSEMHEAFCFWSPSDWEREVVAAGFRLAPGTHAWRNEWMVENRFRGHVALFVEKDGAPIPFDFPETHITLVAERAP